MPNFHMFRLSDDSSLRLLNSLDQPVPGTAAGSISAADDAVKRFLSDKAPTPSQGGRLIAIDISAITQYDITAQQSWDIKKV